MKVLRVLLLLLGILVILNGVFGILMYSVPWVMGVSETAAVDWIKFAAWVLAVVCGFGVLRLKNWARQVLIVLIGMKFLSVAYLFFVIRNVGANTLGLFLILGVFLLFVGVLVGLVRAAAVTMGPATGNLKWWTVAGIVTACLVAGVYGLQFLEIDPVKLEDLPVAAAGELKFLERVDGWKLARWLVTNSHAGSVKMSEYDEGYLKIRMEGNMVALEGIPALKGLNPRIDLSRNALLLNKTVFVGRPLKTDRLLWQDLPAEGMKFKSEAIGLSGWVFIGRRLKNEDVLVLVQIDAYGKDVEAYYVARPERGKNMTNALRALGVSGVPPLPSE